MDQGGSGKVCSACKADVSRAPRVKDTAGRYFCAPCADRIRRQAAAAAPAAKQAAAPDAEPAAFTALPVCRGCGSSVPFGGVVCVQCGLNQQTGQAVTTTVAAAEPDKPYADPMLCQRCNARLKSLSKRTCPSCGHKNPTLSPRERGKASSELMLAQEIKRLLIALVIGLTLLIAVVASYAGKAGLPAHVGAATAAAWWLVDFGVGMLLYLLAALTYKGFGDALWLIALRVGTISAIMPPVGWLLGQLPLSILGLIAYILLCVELTVRFLDMEYQEAAAFALIWSIFSWFGSGPIIRFLLESIGLLPA